MEKILTLFGQQTINMGFNQTKIIGREGQSTPRNVLKNWSSAHVFSFKFVGGSNVDLVLFNDFNFNSFSGSEIYLSFFESIGYRTDTSGSGQSDSTSLIFDYGLEQESFTKTFTTPGNVNCYEYGGRYIEAVALPSSGLNSITMQPLSKGLGCPDSVMTGLIYF